MIHTGRHFLQIPGPTNVPDRVLRAMDHPVIDHRSAEFANLGAEVLEGVRKVFQTASPVVIYPASGTGAWEAAIVNTLSPGDRVLLFETGHFSQLWRQVAEKFAIQVDYVPGNWRKGASAPELETRLAADRDHRIKAVLVVHNETSTGVTSRIPELRRVMDKAHHPALFMVDTISSLGSIDYRHDEWGVDVTIAGSQKGLMLPPGMSFNAISGKARAWGLEIVCEEPREYSSSLTAVFLPEGHDADKLRAVILENFDMSLGAGLSKLAGKVFRIGHLGSFNDLMLAGTLCGVEMGLRLAGVPHKEGGVLAALNSLAPADRKVESAPMGR